MSAQPKRTPEWTAESVGELVGETFNGAWAIADAHNAALAAEREKVKGLHAACRAERAGANEAKATHDAAYAEAVGFTDTETGLNSNINDESHCG